MVGMKALMMTFIYNYRNIVLDFHFGKKLSGDKLPKKEAC
jgi:hypothetical protein